MQKLLMLWRDVRASLWFVPAAIVAGAVVLAVALIEAGDRIDPATYAAMPRLFGAGAEGSRGLLTAVATSMITVAGVVFSITIVALAQASTQYSPRVLRNFMADRANQVVLGVFVGIFAYCLVVLRTIRGGDEGAFVPPLAVLGGVALALVGVGFLIYFIHHIALSIQADHILAAVAAETTRAVDHLFPDGLGAGDGEPDPEEDLAGLTWRPVPAPETGYVKSVDEGGLLRLAGGRGVVVRMECGVGEFVVEGSPLASIGSSDGKAPADAVAAVGGCFDVGRQRTVEQDVGFGLRQAVDVALKALSPGVNDTTTAVQAVDYLTAILVRLAGRQIPPACRRDGGALRVVARRPGFADYLGLAFDQIRRSGEGNVAVLARLLHALGVIGAAATDRARRAALLEQARAVAEVVRRTVPATADRTTLEAAADGLSAVLHSD